MHWPSCSVLATALQKLASTYFSVHGFRCLPGLRCQHCNDYFSLSLFWARNMAVNNLRQQQLTFVGNLVEQGIADKYIEDVLDLRSVETPQYFIGVINTFLSDADDAIAQLSRLLSEPDLDYERATCIVHRVKGSCSSMGGCRAALAFGELRNACDEKMKERSLELFERVKEEYQALKDAYNTIAQFEMNIMSQEGGGRQG